MPDLDWAISGDAIRREAEVCCSKQQTEHQEGAIGSLFSSQESGLLRRQKRVQRVINEGRVLDG